VVAESSDDRRVARDSNGNALNDGDSGTVINDLKVKGTSLVVKVGTKVKNKRSATTGPSPGIPASCITP